MARTPGSNERTSLSDMRANFALKDGALYTQSFVANHQGWLRLAGIGTLDVEGDAVDFALRAFVGSPPKTAAELAGLRGKSVPLRLKGYLSRPEVWLENQKPLPAAKPAAKPVATPAGVSP